MPGPLYRVNPFNGDTVAELEDGSLVPADASDAFGRPVNVVNGNVFDIIDRSLLMTGGTTDVWTLNPAENGRINAITPVTMRQVNAPLASPSQRLLSGDFTITDANGNVITLSVDGVHVNRLGKQLGIFTDVNGDTQAVQIPGRFRSTADVQAELGPSWRLATPTETIVNSLRYYLGAHYNSELENALSRGNIAEFPDVKTVSGLIKAMVEAGSVSGYLLATSRIIEAP